MRTATIRTFIAINPPLEIIQSLQEVLSKLLELQILGLRCVGPNATHLTLKFLGNINPENATVICEALDRAAKSIGPFKLDVNELGFFPSLSPPKIIWMGIDGCTYELSKLRTNVEREMADLGFALDLREFKPHITLARVRRSLDSLGEARLMYALKTIGPGCSHNWQVNSVCLTKSILTPAGPIYHNMHTIPLRTIVTG